MPREYILKAVKERLNELKYVYQCATRDETVDGRKLSRSGACVLRSNTKRDICILKLIYQLTLTSKAVFIDDPDALAGFDRLIKN